NMTVTHNPILYAGVTSFDVTANEGALICLTVNGEIIGTGEATGTPVTIDIPGQVPPDQVIVTITLQNFYRYSAVVEVIPPTGPYVVRESFTINDATGGNGDGLMDYGESNLLSLTVENVGVQQADNVVVTLSTTDTYITITDNTEAYGNIAAGATAVMADGFAYDVANDIPDGHNAAFEVSATDGTDTWVSNFVIEGHAPVLEFIDFVINDPTGNGNGKIDPGETVDIVINVENSGSSQALNIGGDLSVVDPYLVINSGNMAFGNLLPGAAGNATFSATAASNTPAGYIASIEFNMEGDLGITGSGMFDVVIGQIPVLILDLDGNQNSATEMEDAIADMEVAFETLTSFPPDLNLYSNIFVCLGIYSDNHVLSSSEGTTLANYLNNGGNLYMEGGDTWYYDSQTAVHAMFGINGTSDGSSDMGTVVGQAGTITDGMTFNYSGDNSWMDHIEPTGSAVKIFQNQSPSYGTAVAYEEGSYNTIGASHEFGGLDDGSSPSTKVELMAQYLDFLGITMSINASFGSSTTEVCENGTVDFFDQSSGGAISWSWTFEGGTPATSAMQNPTITYSIAGLYDVTLEVSDGTETSSITLNDYINVIVSPDIPGSPSGPAMVCADMGSSSYNTSGSIGADTYDWVLDPSSAGTISGSGTSITISWQSGFLGDATLKVAAGNDCGMSAYSANFDISVYLPEVTLDPFEDVCLQWPAFELTGGLPEGGVYSGAGVDNGWFDPSVAGMGTHTITYTYEDPNGCSNYMEETILVDPCTGVGENDLNKAVSIFPNPNNGSFTLQLALDQNEVIDIAIYNALNEMVYSENNVSNKDYSGIIDLSNYAQGIYYLRIKGLDQNVVKKIIIQE
ncbi:MAG: T9SS type A sorting domain-containing protein, partial [Bacteroidales bacterium]|nr:T9SS type A sorting domain-containing protein [Bacteroidales bacterium]MCF8402493.1 T9SS type A sorting domain-containing protein [Bacteroidales bacterium]